MYPKNQGCIYSLTHSSNIMEMILRFQRSQQYIRIPNRMVKSKDIAKLSLTVYIHSFG